MPDNRQSDSGGMDHARSEGVHEFLRYQITEHKTADPLQAKH
jgi:hypothetical protein